MPFIPLALYVKQVVTFIDYSLVSHNRFSVYYLYHSTETKLACRNMDENSHPLRHHYPQGSFSHVTADHLGRTAFS